MPRAFELTWQPGAPGRRHRWKKKYRGKAYYFDGGSGKYDKPAYDAAVEAWKDLRRKLDAEASDAERKKYERAIADWESVLAWCVRHGDAEMRGVASDRLELLRSRLAEHPLPPFDAGLAFAGRFQWPTVALPVEMFDARQRQADLVELSRTLRERPIQPATPADARVLAATLATDPLAVQEAVWQDRLESEARSAGADRGATVGETAAEFLKEKDAQAAAKTLSMGRAFYLRVYVQRFVDFVGPSLPVSDIDSRLLQAYRTHVVERMVAKNERRHTANEHINAMGTYLRWLWESEAIESLPRILQNRTRSLRIPQPRSEIVVFEIDEIKTLLAEAAERTKLYILLQLNCGFTQKDISDLAPSEVDWKAGRIRRRRSKTRNEDNVPIVNYLLWPETFRLLQEHRSVSPERALLNSNGKPLLQEFLLTPENGTQHYTKNDNVKNSFDRLRKKTKINKPMKSLKKTSASLIRGHERFSGVEDLFLGHAPQRMSDRHYAKAPEQLLDDALAWLGQQYGVSN